MVTNSLRLLKQASLAVTLAATALCTGSVFAVENSAQLLVRCAHVPEAIHEISPSDIQVMLPLMLATAEAMGKAGMSNSDVGAYLEGVFRHLADKGFVTIDSNAKGFKMTLEWDGGLLCLVSTGRCIPPYGSTYELQFRGDGHEFEHTCADGKKVPFALPIPFYNPHFTD